MMPSRTAMAGLGIAAILASIIAAAAGHIDMCDPGMAPSVVGGVVERTESSSSSVVVPTPPTTPNKECGE